MIPAKLVYIFDSPPNTRHNPNLRYRQTSPPMSPSKSSSTPSKDTKSSSSSNNVEFEPPLACVRRLLKHALPSSTNVGKDASSAFTRACGLFVIYITTCANDFARENRRQTITANDVMAAVNVSFFVLFCFVFFDERDLVCWKINNDKCCVCGMMDNI